MKLYRTMEVGGNEVCINIDLIVDIQYGTKIFKDIEYTCVIITLINGNKYYIKNSLMVVFNAINKLRY